MSRWIGGVAATLWVACAACSGSGHDTAIAAATPDRTAAAAPAPQATAAGMAHGDHTPHHGGVVYMYDDIHYEVLLDRDGHHRVYFTDAMREDLPAAVASTVTLTVERPRSSPETLSGAVDQQGESWLLEGQPVADKDTSVRVAFVVKGSEYWIDVPFSVPAQ